MIKKFNTGAICTECNEVINNPLCPLCLSKEIKEWLNGKPFDVRKVVEKEIKNILNKESCLHNSGCVICNTDSNFICPYCFTEKIFNKMKKERVVKNLLSEFLTFFNFDFEHTGYSEDAEELGVI